MLGLKENKIDTLDSSLYFLRMRLSILVRRFSESPAYVRSSFAKSISVINPFSSGSCRVNWNVTNPLKKINGMKSDEAPNHTYFQSENLRLKLFLEIEELFDGQLLFSVDAEEVIVERAVDSFESVAGVRVVPVPLSDARLVAYDRLNLEKKGTK